MRVVPTLLLAACVARSASANVWLGNRNESSIAGPNAESPRAKVLHEELVFDCSIGADDDASCRFEAIYTIANPSESHENLSLTFEGIRVGRLVVRRNGTAIPSSPTLSPFTRGHESHELARFDLPLDAREEATLSVTGTMHPSRAVISPGYGEHGGEARHMYFGERETRPFDFEYLLAPIRSWSGVGPIDVTVRYPAHIDFDDFRTPVIGFDHHFVGSDGTNLGWDVRTEDDHRLAHVRFEDGKFPDTLSFRIGQRVPNLPIHGPLAGVIHTRGGGSTRLFAGWEVEVGRSWYAGATVETNFGGELALVPQARLITDMTCVGGLGLLVGAPLRYTNDLQPGLRLQVEYAVLPLALFLAGDVFPGAERERARLGFGFQLGL